MTDGALSSAASTEIRSIGTLLLPLVPLGLWFTVTSWCAIQLGPALASRQRADLAPPVLSWAKLQECPFDRRAVLLSGMHRLLIQHERRHPARAGDPRTEGLRDAQGRMEAELDSLRLATPATWEAAKQEVGYAWHQLQVASEATAAR